MAARKRPGAVEEPSKAQQQEVKKLCERRHPDYVANKDHHYFLRQTYDGGPEYIQANLWRYPAENIKSYRARLKRAFPISISRGLVEAYVGYLLKEEPVPAKDLPSCITAFMEDCDGQGGKLIDKARTVATWALGYGVVWVCVDKPPLPPRTDDKGQPKPYSEQEERELGLMPYAEERLVTTVLDGKIEGDRILWLLTKEDYRDDADPFTSSGEMRCRFRLWTPEFVRTFEEQKTRQGTFYTEVGAPYIIPPSVGEVPWVCYRFNEGSPFATPGLFSDIAYIERAIFNLYSQLDEILCKVTFPQLKYPLEAGPGSAEAAKVLTIGLDSVLPYSPTIQGNGPEYFAPPASPAQELRASIGDLRHVIFSLALMDGEMAATQQQGGAKQAGSGVSKAYIFEKLNKRLAVIADAMEKGWRKVFKLVCKWQGADPEQVPENAWDWPDSFDVKALADDIAEIVGILGINPPSPTLKKELLMGLVRKLLPKADDKLLKIIEQELEAGLENDMMGMGQQALAQAAQQGQQGGPEDEEDELDQEGEPQAKQSQQGTAEE